MAWPDIGPDEKATITGTHRRVPSHIDLLKSQDHFTRPFKCEPSYPDPWLSASNLRLASFRQLCARPGQRAVCWVSIVIAALEQQVEATYRARRAPPAAHLAVRQLGPAHPYFEIASMLNEVGGNHLTNSKVHPLHEPGPSDPKGCYTQLVGHHYPVNRPSGHPASGWSRAARVNRRNPSALWICGRRAAQRGPATTQRPQLQGPVVAINLPIHEFYPPEFWVRNKSNPAELPMNAATAEGTTGLDPTFVLAH
jgi:hypothetical protein